MVNSTNKCKLIIGRDGLFSSKGQNSPRPSLEVDRSCWRGQSALRLCRMRF
jgi:hypothetical protein